MAASKAPELDELDKTIMRWKISG